MDIRRIPIFAEASMPSSEVIKVIYADDLGEIRAFDSEGNPVLFPSAGGGGDMTKAVYDPTAKNADAFSMGNFVETATDKILTDVERANILANNAKVTNANHTGEVTGAGALIISNDAVTNTKLANMAESTIKGRNSGAGAGDPEDLTVAQLKTLLGLEEVVLSGTVTANNNNDTLLAADFAPDADSVYFLYVTFNEAPSTNIEWGYYETSGGVGSGYGSICLRQLTGGNLQPRARFDQGMGGADRDLNFVVTKRAL